MLDSKGGQKVNPIESDYKQAEPSSNPITAMQLYSAEYLDEVLACHRLRAAIQAGIIDPMKLAEISGLPVCLISKFPNVNSITSANIWSQLDAHRRLLHPQTIEREEVMS